MRSIIQRAGIAFFAFSLLLSTAVSASSSDPAGNTVEVFAGTSATSFMLMDGLTDSVLVSSNADRPLPMASTTKIMTCIVALENACLSDVVEIPKDAVGVEGSSVYLTIGEKLTLEELLFALMLESANDAAVAIALHVSGSISDFATLMNQKAERLKMSCTHFVNPHGLPADGHFSTARDLCKLLAYGMKNDAFRVFSGTKKTIITGPNSSKRYLSNHNKLLRMLDDCVAGKTGFTKEAGRCLVTAAEKNGRLLICTTLGDPNDWMDHIALYDYGFSLFEQKQVVSPSQITFNLPVVGGSKQSVQLQNCDELVFWLRRDEPISLTLEAPSFVYSGVQEGDVLGYAVYSLHNKEFARIELVATESVAERNERLSFWEKIIQIIRLWMS